MTPSYDTSLYWVKDKDVSHAKEYPQVVVGDSSGLPKPTKARSALAINLKHLMDTYQAGFQTGINARELERAIQHKYRVKISYQTIRRMRNPYTKESPQLEKIDCLAAFFGVPTWDLLKPQPALTLTNAEGAKEESHFGAISHTQLKKKTRR